jgi:hypothetical protein
LLVAAAVAHTQLLMLVVVVLVPLKYYHCKPYP